MTWHYLVKVNSLIVIDSGIKTTTYVAPGAPVITNPGRSRAPTVQTRICAAVT